MRSKLRSLWLIPFAMVISSCSSSTIVACPYVHPWSREDQSGLLAEISDSDFKGNYPLIDRALHEYQDMRIESKPCALMQGQNDVPHTIVNLPHTEPR